MSSFHPQEERQLARDFVLHYLKDDGVFVTRLLSLNSSDLVVTEIINQLWLRYKAANRLYSSSQGSRTAELAAGNPAAAPLSSNGSNSHMTNESQRQRSSRIPPPPPPPPPLPPFVQRSKSQQLKTAIDSGHEQGGKSAKDTDV